MISRMYQSGLAGWVGKTKAAKHWLAVKDGGSFVDLNLKNDSSRKLMLYDVTRKVLGKDTENYAQEIGDCVSFGAKNAIEYVQCTEILMKGEREKFRSIFPPYLYGTGRVLVGQGQMNGTDGSSGSWMADAVIKYGTLAADEHNVPHYSGSIAHKWGDSPGPPKEFIAVAKEHPVKSAALISSWEELIAAICNGYPCTVASNQGFEMEARNDGFHAPSGTWSHQMCIIGVDDEHNEPYAIVLNNWGDVHGQLKDFTTEEDLPVGVLRVKKRTIERMIAAGETFAYSNFEGFPEQPIAKELFKLI
jgi:hypothetical protein